MVIHPSDIDPDDYGDRLDASRKARVDPSEYQDDAPRAIVKTHRDSDGWHHLPPHFSPSDDLPF